MLTLTTMDLRKNLGHILDTVAEKNEQVIISRSNRPLAVILQLQILRKRCKKNRNSVRLEAY